MKVNLILSVSAMILVACVMPVDEPIQTTTKEDNGMGLDSTPITPVNDPNSLVEANPASKVYPPLATTTTLANDVGAAEQVLRNQTHTLNEVKVDRAGDTMTGTLLIAPTSGPGLVAGAALASNQPAAQFVGDGTGAGLTAQGGATGPGLQMISGAGAAGEAGRSIGYMHYTGTQPAKGTDPGDNNVQHGTNITKAWGTVSLTGGAPYATIDDYNVTNVTEPIANIYRINFVRPFANATYAITFTAHSPGAGVSISSKNSAYCEFNVWETDMPGTPFPNRTVDFIAVGRQ